MISHLDGLVCTMAPEGAVIEVGGVGLLVQSTPGTLATLRTGDPARVATSLVVREDALTLYGFATDDERNMFELLQTASGVGPRLALAMLAVFTPDGLRRAVATEDLAALTRVPGSAGRARSGSCSSWPGGWAARRAGRRRRWPGCRWRAAAPRSWRDQVRAGLVSLGWQARDAEQHRRGRRWPPPAGPGRDVDVLQRRCQRPRAAPARAEAEGRT